SHRLFFVDGLGDDLVSRSANLRVSRRDAEADQAQECRTYVPEMKRSEFHDSRFLTKLIIDFDHRGLSTDEIRLASVGTKSKGTKFPLAGRLCHMALSPYRLAKIMRTGKRKILPGSSISAGKSYVT